MLRFFRHIRQKLIQRENMRKYVWYALGEILLVVIGILIALQINNWNEERKSRSYELTMLSEVHEVLITDARVINNWIPHLKDVQYSFNQLASMKKEAEINSDSLLFHLEKIKGYGIAITINKAPFEAIKSGGLDRITNPDIRNNLSNLYGFRIESAEEWINEVHRVELFKRNDIIYDLIEISVKPEEGSDVSSAIILNNPEAIISHPRYNELLSRSSWPLGITIRLLSEICESMTILIEQIELELNK